MKVLLVSNYLPDAQQSMLRYGHMLQRELSAQGYSVDLVHPPAILGDVSFLPSAWKKWAGYIDKFILAPSWLRRRAANADVVHICDHSNAVYLRCAGRRPALVTCHDLLAIFAARDDFRETRTGFTGRLLQRWIASHLARAPHVICVSEKTQKDLVLLAPGILPRTTVIRHHLNWNYVPASPDAVAEARKTAGLPPASEYLLHVGGNQWYKNRVGTMRIFSALRRHRRFREMKLVMAGKPWTREMLQYRRSCGLEGEIIERADISNEELQALYTGAAALLFPSLEEGFGWPILEAQACGCPVITSNRSPMTEVAGEGAVFIDPTSPEPAAQIIADRFADLDDIRDAGFRNLGRFTKELVIGQYLRFYETVLKGAKGTENGLQ